MNSEMIETIMASEGYNLLINHIAEKKNACVSKLIKTEEDGERTRGEYNAYIWMEAFLIQKLNEAREKQK